MSSSHRFSLAGKISVIFSVAVVAVAGVAAGLSALPLTAWEVFIFSLPLGLILGLWLLNHFLASVNQLLKAVSDGIRSFNDSDFSVRLVQRRDDELGELVSLYNRMADVLHEERKSIRQKELLLQTALDRSPAAILLVNALDRIVYCNIEARRLLVGGSRLKGYRFREMLEKGPLEMREVLEAGSDGLFSIDIDGERETYHVSRRRFTLNQQPHTLYLLRRLTAELRRQEAQIWKNAIRIISHELNNSLAPISSLARSAQLMTGDASRAERLDAIFRSIRQSTDQLKQFLEGYARFARLPEPNKRSVDWGEFLEGVRTIQPFELVGDVPRGEGFFDPVHMRQVMTNLLKNAVEAGGPGGNGAAIDVKVTPSIDGGAYIQVMDRGPGLSEEVMRRALLPFYSTKQSGAGLGLPLCREIVEAHGGRIRIQNREGGGTIVTCWIPPRN